MVWVPNWLTMVIIAIIAIEISTICRPIGTPFTTIALTMSQSGK